jgi:cyclic pyranopterin phosphate synthase
MVDVSTKDVTRRTASASCRVLLGAETTSRLRELPKGDAVVVARLAGIQAAKRVGDLVPLAHPLLLDHVEVTIDAAPFGALVRSHVVTTGRTGAEMEATVACAGAALALYDMVKAVERGAVVTDLRLEAKSGGKSGEWKRDGGASSGRGGTPRADSRRGQSRSKRSRSKSASRNGGVER